MINKIILILSFFIVISNNNFAQHHKKRSESFFGFHFDFHATESDSELGKDFDEKLLTYFLQQTRPDYIQIDSKGHPGISSYPTKIGYAAKNFVKDPIYIWRKITNELNIPLYVHYSGLWDDKAIHENPNWGRTNADGSKDLTKAGYISQYTDQLMIPQLKELIDRYKIDGAWVDGDCWATGLDYSAEMIKGFLGTTGLKVVPEDSNSPNFDKWLDYNRSAFKEFLRKYVDEIHRYNPNFQITSNWAYSSMMPEQVDINVDFLSGDVSGKNCVYSAAFQSRCLALQAKPWDLMSWGFVPINFSAGIHSPKSLIQLQQEAAEVISMGGGFQVYFQQNRDASFSNSVDINAMSKLAEFCYIRKPFCHKSTIIPQIGMWYSHEGWKKENMGVYGWSSNMEPINSLLLDGQHSVEILMDHHLETKMEEYPVIVIPEWDSFDHKLKDRLLRYIENGGNLIVIGAKAVKHFQSYLGVTFEGEVRAEQFNIGDIELGGITGINTQWQPVTTKNGTQAIGHVYKQRDYKHQTRHPVASITEFGKGKIAGIYLDMSTPYYSSKHPIYNKLVNQIIDRIYTDPFIKIKGSDKIHMVLAEKNNNLMINLINTNGEHFNSQVMAYNTISHSNSIDISLKVDNRPKSVTLQPDGRELKFAYDRNNKKINFVVPPIYIHSIIEVEMK
ncbi:alpha-L-fucosidase [Proteiniphilum sp. UBA5375]|uniref:alpha-L-fucosidase n=1 Tax=Proteiniphilum sp. UBA5375 TaxID=1947278 RepID=UPI00257E3B95|nr:alpha-L-fucosidase [Proteiniphilum sp. UBA5375]